MSEIVHTNLPCFLQSPPPPLFLRTKNWINKLKDHFLTWKKNQIKSSFLGIGRGLVEKYLSRPETTVIAAVRDPKSDDAKSLLKLSGGSGSYVTIVKIDSKSETDALAAVKSAESQGITSLDVVIANAGIYEIAAFLPVADAKISQLQEHFDVNSLGPVRLFQATRPLLAKSANPRFVLISSVMGSITSRKDFTIPNTSYGTSKAAANYLVRAIHFENDNIAALAIHPGWDHPESPYSKTCVQVLTKTTILLSSGVSTPRAKAAVQASGYSGDLIEVKESVDATVARIDALSKSKGSGEFWSYDGTTIPW